MTAKLYDLTELQKESRMGAIGALDTTREIRRIDLSNSEARMAEMTPAQMQEVFAAVDAFNTEVKEQGAWVFAGGLQPLEMSTVVDNTGAQPVITDGPYAESKEYLGGFWIIEASDLDAALEWGRRTVAAIGLPIEVRPFAW